MMVCDWSEIGLTTVRDVTDSFHRVWVVLGVKATAHTVSTVVVPMVPAGAV